MPKLLALFQNTLGVFGLIAIVALSAFTALGLSPVSITSPVAVASTPSDTLGAENSPEILSNAIPLQFTDSAEVTPEYSTQLASLSSTVYLYTVRLASMERGQLTRDMIRVTNPNTVSVRMEIQANVPQSTSSLVHVSLRGDEMYRIHDAEKGGFRTVTFEVPARGTLDLQAVFEFLQNVGFPSEVSFRISY